MSVISTNNSNPLAPIDRTSETTPLAARYNEQRVDIYGKFSIYQDGTRRRNDQPFLFTDLNQPNSIKLRRKNDSQTSPFRSAIDDVQRMSRFLRSGRGILFSAQQFLIQNQNAFNETRVWNPASILTAAASTPLLRIRPVRHIETSGGIGGILKNFLGGSIGLTPTKSKPRGTATGENVISKTAKAGGASNWPEKGLVRYDTAVGGQNSFNLKYGESSSRQKGFVGAITKSADWKLRPEYSRKINVYKQMLEDKSDLLSFRTYFNTDTGRASTIDRANTVHRYSPIRGDQVETDYITQGGNFDGITSTTLTRGDLKYTPSQPVISTRKDVDLFSIRSIKNVYGNIIKIKNSGELGKFYPFYLRNSFTFDPREEPPSDDVPDVDEKPKPPTASEKLYNGGEDGTESSNFNDQVLNNAVARFNRENKINDKKYNYEKIKKSFYTKSIILYKDIGSLKTVPSGSLPELEEKRGFSTVGKPDEINILFPILGEPDEIPSQITADGVSKDLIYFYFYDVANKIYLPFRATIESISDNNAADWEDFQYIGRADRLFIYRGFTRDMNFNFTVHANSVFELQPMWHRINYLTGLTRPSKYTKSSNGQSSGEFIVPPLVKLRIGDVYVDLPIVIRSVGITIPETAIWELTRGEKYDYRGIEADVKTAQLPMTVQLQINAAVLEKERAEGGPVDGINSKTRFFGESVKGFEAQGVRLSRRRINEIVDQNIAQRLERERLLNSFGNSPPAFDFGPNF